MAISIDEANAIIAKTDPRHVAYYNNDPVIKADVEGAFSRHDPSMLELGGHVTHEVADAATESLKNQPPVPQGEAPLPPEVVRAQQGAMSELRGEFGSQTDSILKTAATAAQEIFGSPAALKDFCAKHGIDRSKNLTIEGVKFLAKLKR